jgi:hypothetical protein
MKTRAAILITRRADPALIVIMVTVVIVSELGAAPFAGLEVVATASALKSAPLIPRDMPDVF